MVAENVSTEDQIILLGLLSKAIFVGQHPSITKAATDLLEEIKPKEVAAELSLEERTRKKISQLEFLIENSDEDNVEFINELKEKIVILNGFLDID